MTSPSGATSSPGRRGSRLQSRHHAAVISPAATADLRTYARAVASWYVKTTDPYAPLTQNIEARLRHPVHVVTRRLLYGTAPTGADELEALFNEDDAATPGGGTERALTRRSAARMATFLANCSALAVRHGTVGAGSSSAPMMSRAIDRDDLYLRLYIYFRTLQRMRSIADADPSQPMEECVLQYVNKKGIRYRVQLLIQAYLGNVSCVKDVHKTLVTLVLRATLEGLAVECWCPELRSMVERLASEYEHKVSFASLAFLSSPDSSAETHLAPLLTKYFEYLQLEWRALVEKCELERMLRTVLDKDLRRFFQNSVFQSVGHVLNECRLERESLDNIALPPPWMEGSFGMVGGGDNKGNVETAVKQYCGDPALMKQARQALRREVITLNGQPLPPSADSLMDVAEHLGQILNSKPLTVRKSKKKVRRKRTNYASDFGLEQESEISETESDASLAGKITVDHVDALARRLLIAASRMGTGGDAYLIVRDLFGGEEAEVRPRHSTRQTKVNQGTIEIVVAGNAATIKSHAMFDIFPKSPGDGAEALIQFHTTTTETVTLQRARAASFPAGKEKDADVTGWRTLAIRPAYYERVPQMN